MRKTIVFLIALSGMGALAQAKDLTATDTGSPTIEASQPLASAVREEGGARPPRPTASAENRSGRDDDREHHRNTHDDDEDREHGRRQ
jgi:hypothetical protein